MVRLSEIAVDPKRSEDGVWLEFVPGFKVKIARTGNPKFRQFVINNRNNFTNREELVRRAMAATIILDWEGLEDESQVVEEEAEAEFIPYSPETAYEILSNPLYRPFEEWVDMVSGIDANFRPTEEETGKS